MTEAAPFYNMFDYNRPHSLKMILAHLHNPKEGAYYFRANQTVHFTEGYGYWANWGGDETPMYKTLKGFIKHQLEEYKAEYEELKSKNLLPAGVQ
jgi:hypothetical protein